jgi:hypothetical protein
LRRRGFDGSRGGFAQEVFELGEYLFDQVQVRGVFRQEERALPLILTHGWPALSSNFQR